LIAVYAVTCGLSNEHHCIDSFVITSVL